MKLPPHLSRAAFVARLNRFLALMRRDGQDVLVHIANSGRLQELLRPENPMLLAPAPSGAARKTTYDLALAELDTVLVSADARLPNTILREAIEADRVPEFSGFDTVKSEVALGESRIDLALAGPSGLCYVEVKSVTLVEDGVGLFPDAPSQRGTKHVLSLMKAVQQGHRAAVVFVIQRSDARSFSPNEPADPNFCDTLRVAVEHGLEVYAYRCDVSRSQIVLSEAVPARLT